MDMDHVLLARKVTLAPTGIPGDVVTFTLESGIPYRYYTAWVYVGDSIGTVDVDAQPLFGGANDGTVTNITSSGVYKVYQISTDEIRPPTTINKHPSDTSKPFILKSELSVTNNDSESVEVTVYMIGVVPSGV